MRLVQKPLVEKLTVEPYTFSFHQVVRLLNAWRQTRMASNGNVQSLRMGAHAHLNWPPGDVFLVDIPKDTDTPIRLNVNFMGLAGVQGPLPMPYTEILLKRTRQGDFVLQDFLDIFHNRLLHLLHSVERHQRVIFNTVRPHETALGRTFLCVAGLGEEGVRDRMAIPDQALPFSAGIMWQQPRSKEGLRQIIENYLSVPTKISPPVGRWVPITSDQQSRIGIGLGQLNALGDTAVLGKRAWQQDYYVDAVLGEMSRAMYERLIPTGHAFAHIRDVCHLYVRQRCSVRIKLKLQAKDRTHMCLDGKSALGWTSFLQGHSSRYSDQGAQYLMHRVSG